MELSTGQKKHLKRFYDALIEDGINVKSLNMGIISDIDDGQDVTLKDIRRDVAESIQFDHGLIKRICDDCQSLQIKYYLTKKGISTIQKLF